MNSFQFWKGKNKSVGGGEMKVENKKLNKEINKLKEKRERFDKRVKVIKADEEELKLEKSRLNNDLVEFQLNGNEEEEKDARKRIREVTMKLEDLNEEKEAYKRKFEKGLVTSEESKIIRNLMKEENIKRDEEYKEYQEEEKMLTEKIMEMKERLDHIGRKKIQYNDNQINSTDDIKTLYPVLRSIEPRFDRLSRGDLSIFVNAWILGSDVEYLFERNE